MLENTKEILKFIRNTKYKSYRFQTKNTFSNKNNNCNQTEGSNVTLECVASGSPEPEVGVDINL